jgi:hypothetical protein
MGTLPQNAGPVGSTSRLLALLLVFALFLVRPSALGQSLTPVGLGLTAVAVVMYAGAGGLTRQLSKSAFQGVVVVGAAFLFYTLYEFMLVFLYGSLYTEFYFKQTLAALVVIVGYGAFLGTANNNRIFFQQLSTTVALLGASCLITLILFQFFNRNSLHLFDIAVKGYSDQVQGFDAMTATRTGAVYFPLSMLYGDFRVPGFDLARFSGMFREAGIFQAIASFCFAVEWFTRKSKLRLFGHVAAVIASFSTLGVAVLAGVGGLIYIERKGLRLRTLVIAAAFAVAAICAVLYMPAIGLATKAVTHATSVDTRTDAIKVGTAGFLKNPLGAGPYSDPNPNASISLIASIGQIGLIGFLLQVIVLSGVRGLQFRLQLRRIVACMPLLVTALVSEPLAGQAMIYILAMVSLPRIDERELVTEYAVAPAAAAKQAARA